jgi:hypothetical protein
VLPCRQRSLLCPAPAPHRSGCSCPVQPSPAGRRLCLPPPPLPPAELACLTLYLAYEKKRGKDSCFYSFIKELDRMQGRGSQVGGVEWGGVGWLGGWVGIAV